MSLEITILGSDGSPEHVLPVGVNTHHQFIERVRSKPKSILARMDDYYADAEFNSSELIQVSKEIDWLLEQSSSDENLVKFLNAFKAFVELAKSLSKDIEVLAD